MLAADTQFDLRPDRTPLLDRDTHESADSIAVKRLERGDAEDPQLEIAGKEGGLHVVPGETPAHLGEVVRAEREELRGLGDLARGQGGPRYLDHRPDQRGNIDPGLGRDLAQHLFSLVADDLQLLDRGHQRHHDLRMWISAGPAAPHGRLGDRPHLQGEQTRDEQPQPYPAQPQHRILLVQPADRLQQRAIAVRHRLAGGGGDAQAHREFGEIREELVQRRVDQADRHRQTVHRREDRNKVVALKR